LDNTLISNTGAQAAQKADPKCKILAGIGYINTGQIMKDFYGDEFPRIGPDA